MRGSHNHLRRRPRPETCVACHQEQVEREAKQHAEAINRYRPLDVSQLPTLDRDSGESDDEQIADHLRAAIVSGQLAAGDMLPSDSAMMAHYGVSRRTVQQAIYLLQREGLVEVRWGRGYCVTRPNRGPLPADVRDLLEDLAGGGTGLPGFYTDLLAERAAGLLAMYPEPGR